MSEPKFTPGPWVNNQGLIESELEHGWVNGGWCIAECFGSQAEINAHLIAAAPDLYRELEMARFTIAMEIATMGPRTLDQEEKEALIAEHPAIKSIDAALAKARGEG